MRLLSVLFCFAAFGCSTSASTDTADTSDTSGGDTSDTSGGNDGYGDGACISGDEWTGGNRESELMNPGEACIACHKAEREGPNLVAAGTVYTNYDEPDDCNGIHKATVRLTDADGEVYEEETNSAGNFLFQARDYDIKTPFNAEVEFADGTIAKMSADLTTGDCNACHTQDGAEGAPGRISQASAN